MQTWLYLTIAATRPSNLPYLTNSTRNSIHLMVLKVVGCDSLHSSTPPLVCPRWRLKLYNQPPDHHPRTCSREFPRLLALPGVHQKTPLVPNHCRLINQGQKRLSSARRFKSLRHRTRSSKLPAMDCLDPHSSVSTASPTHCQISLHPCGQTSYTTQQQYLGQGLRGE